MITNTVRKIVTRLHYNKFLNLIIKKGKIKDCKASIYHIIL